MQEAEQALNSGVQILDARAARRFYVEAAELRLGLHCGHIPSSINIPYSDLLENGHFKPLTALKHTFSEKGVDIQGSIITTCGSGVTAAVLAFGLLSLGAPLWSNCMTYPKQNGALSGKQPIAQKSLQRSR